MPALSLRSRGWRASAARVALRSARSLSATMLLRSGVRGARLGLAVPKAAGNAVVRNRIKRQLREIWHVKLEAEAIARANDYVLVVRPGLPEAAEARGHGWLVERVDEVLGKAAA